MSNRALIWCSIKISGSKDCETFFSYAGDRFPYNLYRRYQFESVSMKSIKRAVLYHQSIICTQISDIY